MARQGNVKILGDSPAVHELLSLIQKVSAARTNILVIGESGTGKELVARMIHESGPLKDRPFVPVNCGAIPENLIESELFGHKRGSFTGAVADKVGLFEVAGSGTLFLDEVGELPLGMQVKLLRALQERRIRRVGDTQDVKVDARIIAATNRDLEQAVAKGTFREDLYYRLNVILIKTPPLRERRGDVTLLANAFLASFGKKFGKKLQGFEPAALAVMERYAWPGNVRELENTVERAVTLESGALIGLADLPSTIANTAAMPLAAPAGTGASSAAAPAGEDIRIPAPDFSKGPVDLDKILGEVERVFLERALKEAGGTKKKAADLLGVTFRSIRYRLKKQGLEG